MVIGGARDGALYVRQLLRAAAAGRLDAGRIVVVDRDPRCAARAFSDPRVEHHAVDWSDWLDAQLRDADPADELVPYHWAPHLLVEWLRREAGRAGARAERVGGLAPLGLPFERDTRDGDRALSYATWLCPPTCIEPALCPHTRGPKHWSLAGRLAAERGPGFDAALALPSLHLVYGVASIPVAAIQAARRTVLEGFRHGPRRYLVATASHCHGLATLLHVTPPAPR